MKIQRVRDFEGNVDFKVLADLIANDLPFQITPGIRVAEIKEGRVRLFGGVISTLAAVCAGFAVRTRCKLDVTALPPSTCGWITTADDSP